MRLLKLLLILVVCAAGPAVAGPLEDGLAATQKGDYATAVRLLHPLAEQGNVHAQSILGVMYETGQGVPQDHAAAVFWYRKAAEQGDASAQRHLQELLGRAAPAVAGPFEDGVAAHNRADYGTALRLWRPLADQGDASAQYNLGLMYAEGQGVPQDYAAAMSWYRKAAEQGNAGAQYNLGYMYNNGLGVPQDYAAAAAWYRKAADQGQARAQTNLGLMYAEGQGVPQDYVQAHMWWNLAAAQNNASGVKNRDIVAKKMTPAQIAEAQKLAREWKPTQPIVSPTPPTVSVPPPQSRAAGSSIPMKKAGGTYVVPVLINNAITLDFIVDSGASDVTIPEDVVSTLVRAGTILDADFIGEKTYVLADGSRVKSKTFRIRSLKVGDRVLENVTGSVASTKGSLLLGQSFLGRFKSWSIDNSRHVLLLE